MNTFYFLSLFFFLCASRPALKADAVYTWPFDAHWQVTTIPQGHGSFGSPYSGMNSLQDEDEVEASLTSTLFLGTKLLPDLELYADPELYGGNGISDTLGIADFPNGEIYRVSSPAIQVGLARLYLQWILGLGSETETVASAQNQIPEERSRSRFVVVAGKFGLSDFFDDNSYSHDPRNQFFNWALMDMGAWDYAADVRGYTNGIYLELDLPLLNYRFAEVQEPEVENGPTLDNDIIHAHSENMELDLPWTLKQHPGALKVLGFWNTAHMGNYQETIDTPSYQMNIDNSASLGARKYGFGINMEQEIGPNCGIFSRLSWNDGTTETWAFTEIDQSASLGLQLGGKLWGRSQDQLGLAGILSGISPGHEYYLADGGYGFLLGDGALNYAPEAVYEIYYNFSPYSGLSFSPDYQYVVNPAYNQDRGPVPIFGLRLHFEI